MIDFAQRRTIMVDTQVRPSDVTKFPIIEAMLTVPREAFVPQKSREAAYAGENVPLGGGRVMLEPRTLAKLLDGLDVQPGERVLDLGPGLGYSAALLAELAGEVVAVEEGALAEGAQAALKGVANVTLVAGPLAAGAPAEAPFDVIMIEGAIEHLPEAIAAQLQEGGRIAALFSEDALGVARIGHKIDGAIAWRFAFNASAPVLPGFEKERAFVF
jgi:protein-L-isoaspartate(D-aspartate) O-methyltransferase